MKKVFCSILVFVMVISSISAGAVGISWSKDKLSTGELTATATGVKAGDRVAVAVFSGGVFSKMDMAWSEGDTASVSVTVESDEDTVRAFVWEQSTMMPKYSDAYITADGVMSTGAIFSDNQIVNKADAIGYRAIDALTEDYTISFYLTVLTKGDNAIMLGDSSNGDLGYGEASAILQFNGDNFTTRRGNGTGGYSQEAVTLCPVELNKLYKVTICGNIGTNTFQIVINDGENEYASEIMRARTNAVSGIDTIAFVSNSKNTTVVDGYCSDFNFFGTDFVINTDAAESVPLYTYTGLEGVYYGLEVVADGKYVRGNNGKLTADYTAVSDTSAMFIPRDMGDGSHAFVCKSSSNRMTTTGVSGTQLTSSGYAADNNTQHWVLEESENYSADNLTYYFRHIDSGNYIGTSGTNLALVAAADKKEIRLEPLKDESPMYLISQTDVYNMLTSSQRERLESVYESVAGDVFGRYGGNSEWTPRIRMDNLFNEILAGTLTKAEQLTKLEEFLTRGANSHIYDGQASYQTISGSLPETDGLYWEIDEGTAGNYDFWRGTMLDGMLYKLTIYNADGSVQQTIDLYVEDQSTAQVNANTFKNVVVEIPYVFRQHLKTVKVRNDSANSYNGGGNDMYIRLNWSPDHNNMKSTVVHELGHIVDSQNGNWSAGSGWASAISQDMYAPSTYGATNATEDFAEFCRMYFSCYGNPDMQKGLKDIMPARYASFGRLRQNNMNGWGLWEDEYTN